MVISTGMSTEGEIRETVELIRSTGRGARASCTASRPIRRPSRTSTSPTSTRLAELAQARSATPVTSAASTCRSRPSPWVPGSSRSTSPSTAASRATTTRSACCPASSRRWSQRIREVEEALGTDAPRAVSTGEMMNRVNLAKSLVAARRIEVGDVLTADDVDIKSPGRGLQPNAFDKLVGRTGTRAFERRRLLLRHRPRRRRPERSRLRLPPPVGTGHRATTTSRR